MVAYAASPTKNRLTMPTGAPAPGPTLDVSADAYAPGTMAVSSKGNALQMPTTPASNPFAAPKGPPRNALLASAFDGFQRGFDPAGFEKRQATNKADGMDKAKQTLALIQQQRALPVEQRTAWWQQNADTIGGIIGQDVRSMPIDDAQFTDQALDGHAAALSAQLGIAPEVAEPMSAYEAAQIKLKEDEAGRPTPFNLGNGAFAEYDPSAEAGNRLNLLRNQTEAPVKYEQFTDASGQVWDVNPYTRERIKADGMRARVPGEGGADRQPPSGYTWTPQGTLAPIPGGPADKRPGEMPLDLIRAEMSLADDWSKIQRDFDEVNSQAERAKALGGLANQSKEAQSAADLALIVTATKILDPTSVAREGEVKLTQSSASIWQQVQNLPNQWQYGQTTLPPAQRQALLQMIESLMPSYRQAYENRASDMKSSAQAYGFGEQRVMPGYRPSPAQVEQARRAQNAGAILGGTGEFNPETFKNMRINNIPRDAVSELRADPSPEALAEFNEAFGAGAAEAILNGSR